jgi:hypothetical protein
MDNQHRLISGYRDLTQEEVDLINSIKESGGLTGDLVAACERIEGVDQRALSIARTHLQTGFMWLVRAVAKPGGF